MNNTIVDIKSIGYKVYIIMLSVNRQLSFLGTRIRYESMKAQDGYGRLVDKSAHDAKYEAVLNTLEIVEKAGLYDRLLIYGRAGRQKIKGMRNGLVLINPTSQNAFNAYKNEREKEWSDNDQRFFNQDILYLVRMMIQREAPHNELLDVMDTFEAGKEPPL